MKQQWDSQSGDISTFDQERVLRQIESKINRASTISRRRAILSFVASIAASILLVTGIGYYLFHKRTTSGNDAAKTLVCETLNKERREVTLPDSSKVWLNAGSRIEYPEVFDQSARRVKLCGEAYFDVTHQPKRPFYVLTGNLQIQVFGTRFTVSDYQNGEFAETVLLSGKVKVSVLSDSNSRKFELRPNEQLLFDAKRHATTIRTVDASQMSDWINGKLSFDNAELGFIIEKLEHWYGQKINCRRELSSLYRLTFTVRQESLPQIIQLMETIAPIKFQQTQDGSYQVIATTYNNKYYKQ